MSSKTQMIPLVTSCIPTHHIGCCLDCGCGFGKWSLIFRTQVNGMRNSEIIGLDIFRENVLFCKKYACYNDLILADIRHLPFKDNSFDVVVAGEVIEHIPKSDGHQFLTAIEKLSKGRVIITTPNGDWPDNPQTYEWGSINVNEEHKCFWVVQDFMKKSYTVHAIGLKLPRLPNSAFIQQIVAGTDFLLFPSWFLPQVGRHLVAFKDRL